MVIFEEKGFTIHVNTGCDPIEEWMELHRELTEVLSAWDSKNFVIQTPYRMIGLIEDMMPDYKVARRMTRPELKVES